MILRITTDTECNLNCRMCDLPNKKPRRRLSLENRKLYIKQFSELYPNNEVMITGGEPLLSNDIIELYKYSKSLGLKTILETNGTLINKHVDFVNNNIDKLIVSIDCVKESHDYIRGKSFELIKSNLKLINVEVIYRTVLMKYTLDYLEDFFIMAREDNVKVTFAPLIKSMFKSRVNQFNEENYILPENYKEDDSLKRVFNSYSDVILNDSLLYRYMFENKTTCEFKRRNIVVFSIGDVGLCYDVHSENLPIYKYNKEPNLKKSLEFLELDNSKQCYEKCNILECGMKQCF